MKLSILTPTIPERDTQVSILTEKLRKQIGNLPVEHLVFQDNRRRSIGAKRQALVDIARGEYIAFVDDDDDVSGDYVTAILEAIRSKPDVVTFRQRAIYNDMETIVEFGINNQDCFFVIGGITLRAPWHVCAWRRAAVVGCQFAEKNFGEDKAWCLQARKRAKTAVHIPRILHTYRHDDRTTTAPPL